MKFSKKNVRFPVYKFLALVIIVVMLISGAYYFGLVKKNCKQDKDCFDERFKKCKAVKVLYLKGNNYYNYVVKGKRGDDCLVNVKIEKMAVGTPLDQVNMFEGKEMECMIPKNQLGNATIGEMKNFINFCHGELKEAMYEQVIQKMYGLILSNMGNIMSEVENNI